MARDNDRNKKRPEPSAISDRQKRLAEEDARNKVEEARLRQMLQAAPAKREELIKKQRDDLIERKSKVVHLDGPIERRFDGITGPRTKRSRRAPRGHTFSQLFCLLLFIILCISLYYAFRTISAG